MTAGQWQEEWLHGATCRIGEPKVWRGVETQHISATLRLVDTGSEHDLLEQMLEDSKPPLPPAAAKDKHYLLAAPFRYTPKTASRFRPVGYHGLWYGSRELRAACAEVAHWRMFFVLDSAGLRDRKVVTRHTFLVARVTGLGIDLTRLPWVAARDAWTSGKDYTETHKLGCAAESAGVQVIQYESVRSPGDTNFAVFSPAALNEPRGGIDASTQSWTCSATRDRVMMRSDRTAADQFEWKR